MAKFSRRLTMDRLVRQAMSRDEGYLAPCPYCSGLVCFGVLVPEDPDGDIEVAAERCGICGRYLRLSVGSGSLHVVQRTTEDIPKGAHWKWSDACKHCGRHAFQHPSVLRQWRDVGEEVCDVNRFEPVV